MKKENETNMRKKHQKGRFSFVSKKQKKKYFTSFVRILL